MQAAALSSLRASYTERLAGLCEVYRELPSRMLADDELRTLVDTVQDWPLVADRIVECVEAAIGSQREEEMARLQLALAAARAEEVKRAASTAELVKAAEDACASERERAERDADALAAATTARDAAEGALGEAEKRLETARQAAAASDAREARLIEQVAALTAKAELVGAERDAMQASAERARDEAAAMEAKLEAEREEGSSLRERLSALSADCEERGSALRVERAEMGAVRATFSGLFVALLTTLSTVAPARSRACEARCARSGWTAATVLLHTVAMSVRHWVRVSCVPDRCYVSAQLPRRGAPKTRALRRRRRPRRRGSRSNGAALSSRAHGASARPTRARLNSRPVRAASGMRSSRRARHRPRLRAWTGAGVR